MTGKVVSIYGNTVIVSVVHPYQHPIYKKTVKRTRKIAAHYEGKDLVVGATVTLKETRPLSRRKHFVVVI